MGRIRWITGVVLLCAAASAGAAGSSAPVPARADGSGSGPSDGLPARIERSVHHGLERTGHALRSVRQSVGHAVAVGLHASGHALQRVGDKLDRHA
jgi:hypothetical protein